MDNCKIEIDFGRQSFRVFRRPFLPEPEVPEYVQSSPCLESLQSAYSNRFLTILDSNRAPPSPRPQQLDKDRPFPTDTYKKKIQRKSETEIAAGGILTSIHVPLQPDNNFDKVFSQMLPEKKTVCLCHRPRQEVDMNKIMFDLVNSVCKATTTELNDLTSTKSKTAALGETFFKRKSTLSCQVNLNTDSKFWIGSEYRYNVNAENLIMKFVLIGTPPENARKLYLDVQVPGRVTDIIKRVKLRSKPRANEIGKEITVPMVSYLRTLEAEVLVTLCINSGVFRRAKRIDEWRFPLDDCHCMYPRSFWRNVKY